MGLRTKLLVAKFGAAFPAVAGARHVLGHLRTLEVLEAPALPGCSSVYPLGTSALVIAGFWNSFIYGLFPLGAGLPSIKDLIVSPQIHMLRS